MLVELLPDGFLFGLGPGRALAAVAWTTVSGRGLFASGEVVFDVHGEVAEGVEGVVVFAFGVFLAIFADFFVLDVGPAVETGFVDEVDRRRAERRRASFIAVRPLSTVEAVIARILRVAVFCMQEAILRCPGRQ